MEDLDKEPEEIPMDEVLSEIRQMLSSDMPIQDTERTEPTLSEEKQTRPEKEVPSVESPASAISDKVEVQVPPPSPRPSHIEPDYFLLTPAMRCDLPSDNELSAQVKVQTQRVLSKLQQETPTLQLSPALEDWLSKNLPAIVEKVLDEKLKHNI